MNEKTPLRRPGSYYVLTASSVDNSTTQKTLKKTERRVSVTEQCLIKCSQALPQRTPLPEFEICSELKSVVDYRLREARRTRDPAPVIVAFTLLGDTHYGNVIDTTKFESTAEYRYQRKQSDHAVLAIVQDQLMVDMSHCKNEYKGICTALLYLHRMEWPMHVVIYRETYKVKNPSESLWECLWQPCLKGHYYKIMVDFGQS